MATFNDPLSPGLDPGPEIGRSAEFAVLATTLSVLIMRAILRKRVTVLWVIAALAMWMLMPGTLLLAWFGGRYWGFAGLVIVMAPVLLMAAALVLIARGFLVRGTAALVLPLLLVVCVSLCQPEPPRAAAWILVPSWNAALALAAAAAATWQQRRCRFPAGMAANRQDASPGNLRMLSTRCHLFRCLPPAAPGQRRASPPSPSWT